MVHVRTAPSRSSRGALRAQLFALVFLASVVGLSFITACSGHAVKTPAKGASGDAGREGGAAQLATTPPPSGLPAMAVMPPGGVAGSKRAKKRADGALAACGGSARPQAKDPGDHVKRIGEGCATASKMKPLGPTIRGQQGDRDAHQENKFRAEANHCYRLYFSGDEAVKDVVIVLRDSAGDIVAESAGPAVPEEGAACFTVSDEVSILVGVGSGKGAWAAQVWSD